jgi:hypothetical protein
MHPMQSPLIELLRALLYVYLGGAIVTLAGARVRQRALERVLGADGPAVWAAALKIALLWPKALWLIVTDNVPPGALEEVERQTQRPQYSPVSLPSAAPDGRNPAYQERAYVERAIFEAKDCESRAVGALKSLLDVAHDVAPDAAEAALRSIAVADRDRCLRKMLGACECSDETALRCCAEAAYEIVGPAGRCALDLLLAIQCCTVQEIEPVLSAISVMGLQDQAVSAFLAAPGDEARAAAEQAIEAMRARPEADRAAFVAAVPDRMRTLARAVLGSDIVVAPAIVATDPGAMESVPS